VQNAISDTEVALREQEVGMNFIHDKVGRIKEGKDGSDGLDGSTPTREELTNLISPLIPEAIAPKEETAEEHRDKLEELEGEERLDKDAIKGLEDMFEELNSKLNRVAEVRSGPNANAIQSDDLTSQLDGENRTFNVSRHRIPLALRGSQFPFEYRFTVDYTTANKTLILTDEVAPPESGQTLTFLSVK